MMVIRNNGEAPSFTLTAGSMYQQIGDAVMDCPGATFDAVVDFARREYGISRENCLNTHKRSLKVYERAKVDYAMEQKVREQFLKDSEKPDS